MLGAAAGYLALWSVYKLFKLVTGKEGMGYGDFKLLAAIGAWLGWQLLPVVILLSAVVGSIVGIALIAFGGRSSQTRHSVRAVPCGRGLHRSTVGRAARAALRGVVFPLGYCAAMDRVPIDGHSKLRQQWSHGGRRKR